MADSRADVLVFPTKGLPSAERCPQIRGHHTIYLEIRTQRWSRLGQAAEIPQDEPAGRPSAGRFAPRSPSRGTWPKALSLSPNAPPARPARACNGRRRALAFFSLRQPKKGTPTRRRACRFSLVGVSGRLLPRRARLARLHPWRWAARRTSPPQWFWHHLSCCCASARWFRAVFHAVLMASSMRMRAVSFASLRRFMAVHNHVHSVCTFSSPRSRNRRNPQAPLPRANTVSQIQVRRR